MVRATFAASLLVGASATTSPDFETYKRRFGKTYKTADEEQHAKDCWQDNAEVIQEKQAANSLAEFGENDFTDLCWEDFKASRLGAKFEDEPRALRKLNPDADTTVQQILKENPSVDWRTSGAVAPIQDQGQCGSCWAFGTIAQMESQHFLWAEDGKKGTFIKLSEQELVSCDHWKDNTGEDKGCQGGWPIRVFKWMMENDGLTTEANYPYVSGGGDEPACQSAKETAKAFNIKDYQELGANEEYIAAYVAKYGPVTIGADATSSWQSYKGGILTADCGQRSANHAIAIVGYGSESGQDYWLIRNSWGTSWGENGYLRLARGKNCNNVAGHVSVGLFGERSLCLEDCGSSTCCGGDCCDTTGAESCCQDDDGKMLGCATADMACCGSEGGHMPCSDASLCVGGTCCDGDSIVMPDSSGRTTCCSPESVCGDVCLGASDKACCNGHVAGFFASCCSADSECRQGDNTCCDGVCCGPFDHCDAATNTCTSGRPPRPTPPPAPTPKPTPPAPTPPGPTPTPAPTPTPSKDCQRVTDADECASREDCCTRKMGTRVICFPAGSPFCDQEVTLV